MSRVVAGAAHFESWRASVRPLLAAGLGPDEVRWVDPYEQQGVLAAAEPTESARVATDAGGAPLVQATHIVPREFVRLAEHAICHRDPSRFDVLYRVLYRLTHERRSLLTDAADEDVHRFYLLVKGVSRDAHKMKAFVRFRRVGTEAGDHYIAWHRPDHRVLPIVAPFFARRFGVMRWTILTPVGTADWNGESLTYGPPATRRDAPTDDTLEEIWRTYYANIYNPARTNLRVMQREMPVRYWGNLPESELIDSLVRAAPTRVQGMLNSDAGQATGAAAYLPSGPVLSLNQLREAASTCQGCDIYCRATQTVFGEGPEDAPLMLVGEQPGDQEDLAGRPFVGPAGEVLSRAMAEAGIPRQQTYVTNAVKHFKWEPDPNRGLRRIHSKPSAREVRACRAWLDHEINVVKPKVIVLLGATAGQSLLGAQFRVSTMRSRLLTDTPLAPAALVATIHPSAILRTPDPALQQREYQALVEDLRLAHAAIR
ncbi:MAG TPA: UdgX family uracil-DNA binding protein [Phycisphaerales bacterium]|nr:UdgX family uracil-DNA binding protein [Phycisphaerales bacterium]